MKSIWTKTIQMPAFPKLAGDKNTGVLIIGGGIAGILCAYWLAKAGIDYVLVEARSICNGVTENTTAKLTIQHGLIYDKLLKEFGEEKSYLYLKANEEALAYYKKLCSHIDCDYEERNNYVYSITDERKIQDELAALDRIGYKAEFADNLVLPFPTVGAVKFSNQAQFNPLKFLAAISKKLNIYENTKVTELSACTAKTDSGTIHADKIIVATHFPINNKHGAYFLKMFQSRTYVMAVANAQDVHGMYVDESENGMSFRNYKDVLILGGGGHRTGKPGGNWLEIESFIKEYYKDAVIEDRWATQDCMSLDKIPYIGIYGKHTKGFYVTTGYNKWGMTSSMVSAMLLRDLVLGKSNPYEEIFYPHRTMLRKQLFVNTGEAVSNLLTFSNKRCPHLGCALKWNEDEHTWDCPCHGSRFTEDGELINNPATDDLRRRK